MSYSYRARSATVRNNTFNNGYVTCSFSTYTTSDPCSVVVSNNTFTYDYTSSDDYWSATAIQVNAGNDNDVVLITNNTVRGDHSNYSNYGFYEGINISQDYGSNLSATFIITGNTIDKTRDAGIRIRRSKNITIKNNNVNDAGRRGRGNDNYSYSGITVQQYNGGTLQLVNNVVDSSGSYGLYLEYTTGVVDSNTVTNNFYGGIKIYGSF